jgi:hypothetical protein
MPRYTFILITQLRFEYSIAVSLLPKTVRVMDRAIVLLILLETRALECFLGGSVCLSLQLLKQEMLLSLV